MSIPQINRVSKKVGDREIAMKKSPTLPAQPATTVQFPSRHCETFINDWRPKSARATNGTSSFSAAQQERRLKLGTAKI